MLRRVIVGVIFLLIATAVSAHKPSDSYLTITHIQGGQNEQDQLQARWDIALKDLEMLVGLDANHNGEITWGEVKARREAITPLIPIREKFGFPSLFYQLITTSG